MIFCERNFRGTFFKEFISTDLIFGLQGPSVSMESMIQAVSLQVYRNRSSSLTFKGICFLQNLDMN